MFNMFKLHESRSFVLSFFMVCFVSFLSESYALNLESCVDALGMKSGKIKDEDINASSSHFPASVGPQNARLELDLIGGAWCPKQSISKDVIEYLEISLNSSHVITAVATQGRFGNGQGLEFAEDYMLEYWRPGLSSWHRFKNRLGQEILEGNTNVYSVVKRELDPIIIASKIRFIPYSVYQRTVCMRVEIYGCPWNEGLISYTLPQGERRGVDVDLSDKTYDGVRDGSHLHGGLGQLVDGQRGEDNFRLESAGMGKGYEWVGWKNESGNSGPIQIVFEFDTVRNFSSVLFYCNNMFTRDVQVFSSAKVWLSIGGEYYNDPPIDFSYMPDLFIQKARNVTIYLHHRIGRFVKLEILFKSKWILISEVSFISVPAIGNFSEEDPPTVAPIVSTAIKDGSLSHEYVGLVIGVLAAVILLLAVVIFVIAMRNKRRKTTPHVILKPVDSRVTINMKDLGLTYAHCSPVPFQQNGSMYVQNVLLKDQDPDKLVYQEPQDCKMNYQGTYSSNGTATSREYAVPDVAQTTSNNVSPLHFSSAAKPSFPQTLPKPLKRPPSERYYAATDVVNLSNVQSGGNSLYSILKEDQNNTIQKDLISNSSRKASLNSTETSTEIPFSMMPPSDSESISLGSDKLELNHPQLPRGSNSFYGDYGIRHEPRPVLGRVLQCRRAGHPPHPLDAPGRHQNGSIYDQK